MKIDRIAQWPMTKKLLAVVGTVAMITACGPSYQEGDEVWVNLPNKNIMCEGYAIGEVDKIRDARIKVLVTELHFEGTSHCEQSKLAKKLEKGESTWIEISDTVPVPEGENRWERREEFKTRLNDIARELAKSILTSESDAEEVKELAEQAKSLGYTDLSDYLSVVHDLLMSTRQYSNELENSVELDNFDHELEYATAVFEKLVDMTENDTYRKEIKSLLKADSMYKLQRQLSNQSSGAAILQYGGVSYYRLKELQSAIAAQITSDNTEALEDLLSKYESVRQLKEKFISELKQYSRKWAKEVADEEDKSAKRLKERIRRVALEGVKSIGDVKEIYSNEEAESIIAEVKSYLKPFEKVFGKKIYNKSDYDRLYRNVVEDNIRNKMLREKREAELAAQRAAEEERQQKIAEARAERQRKLDAVKNAFRIGQMWNGSLRCRQYRYTGSRYGLPKLDGPITFAFNYLIESQNNNQYKGILSIKTPRKANPSDLVTSQFYFSMKVNYDTKQVDLFPASRSIRDYVIDDNSKFREEYIKMSGVLDDALYQVAGKNYPRGDSLSGLTCDLFTLTRTDISEPVAKSNAISKAEENAALAAKQLANAGAKIAETQQGIPQGANQSPDSGTHSISEGVSSNSSLDKEYDDLAIRNLKNAYSLAKSEKRGVDIMAMSQNGDWCQQKIKLKVVSKSKDVFFDGTLARYINHIGSSMDQHCAKATAASIWGYLSDGKKAIFAAESKKSNSWKVEPKI